MFWQHRMRVEQTTNADEVKVQSQKSCESPTGIDALPMWLACHGLPRCFVWE